MEERSASKIAALGSKIQLSYPTRLIKRAWTSEVITEFDGPKAITWSLQVGWLFGLEERFRLYPNREGTRLDHSVRCRGMIAQLGRRPLRKTLAVVICAANDGLRRYVDVPVSVSPMPAAIRRAKAKKKTPVPVSATGSPHQGSS